MHVHTRACLSAYMHGSRNFRQGGLAVRAQLVKKSPDNLFSPQLILQWGPNVYFKETIIFPKSKQGGGSKMSGGPTFSTVMGPNCFFYRIVVFQGVPDSLYPLWISALPMCTWPCLWPFKVTKNEACSKFFKGIDV